MTSRKLKTVLLLGSALAVNAGFTHETVQPAQSTKAQADATVPLYTNLGDLSYPITTASELAQRYFDQGLRLTYAFNHAEALRAFREAQRHDPNCALCYWGEAFVLGPNINAPMDAAASNPAVKAIAKAKTLAHHASKREQALIDALARRYSDDPSADQAALNQAYADAMTEVAKRFPDDHEIAVFTIDALMNLSPWDYWEADGKTPKGKIGEAIAIAEKVLAENPNHPGAIHFYIHLTEASADPYRAEPYADRLADLMPGAGHLVHMGSHTYVRIGRYEDSMNLNKKAVAADEAYLAKVKAEGMYLYGYYPHNIHFVATSAQMAGDGSTAVEYAKRLEGKIPADIAEQIGSLQAILPAPYFVHAQFSDPATTLALPDPGDRFPLVKAMWHYARSVAHVTQGDLDKARREAARIAEINQTSDFSTLLAWAVPAPDLLRIARHVVEGRIAQTEKNYERAIGEFEVAVAIQDSLPYMEPPYWYYPVRQSLGAALLQAGQAEQAEQVFQESLKNYPDNRWALYGLLEAQQAQGKTALVAETRQRFQQAWAGNPAALSLRQL